MLIGVFLMGAIAILLGLIFFLRPSVGDEKQTLYIRFSNINKINVGTRVLFAGKPVGEVTAITQIFHARETQPSDSLGRLYFYQLTLKVDSAIKVFNTDEISLQTSGLLGEKSIAIVPKAPPKGVTPQLITEKVPFYADSIDPIENTFNRLSDIGQKLEDTIDIVKHWLETNTDNLSHAVTAFGGAMDEIHDLAKSVNDKEFLDDMKLGVHNFTASMDKVNNALAQMENDGVFTNFGTVMANLKTTSQSVNSITQEIADGKGTIGKLVMGDDLYLRTTAILSKADTMMNDINHYGILFHLNKSWQRQRTRQISTLNALSSPDAFKTYFEAQIDQINTAMSRISMLITKAENEPDSDKILRSPRFEQDFAELLREVDQLSSNLKLYNEQFAEALSP